MSSLEWTPFSNVPFPFSALVAPFGCTSAACALGALLALVLAAGVGAVVVLVALWARAAKPAERATAAGLVLQALATAPAVTGGPRRQNRRSAARPDE